MQLRSKKRCKVSGEHVKTQKKFRLPFNFRAAAALT